MIINKKQMLKFGQTIAKEVAMRFKEEPDLDADSKEGFGYNQCINDKNALVDQIINELSKNDSDIPILEQERGEL